MLDKLKRMPILSHVYQIPWLLKPYHFLLAFLSAWWYGFPSKRMTVIGVTGTKGKTTTSNLIAQILEYSGRKTGMATTVNFRIGDREWVNDTKQTMLGRFALQKLLKEMADSGCRYAVVETSSEGIAQYRQRFIDYDAVVFTNISPEHIERHGSFEAYRASKVKLFSQTGKKKGSIGVYNLKDPNVEYFLKPRMERKYGVYMDDADRTERLAKEYGLTERYGISEMKLAVNRTTFRLGKEEYSTPLIGEFNVMNAALAATTALVLGVPWSKVQHALAVARGVPGRFEVVNAGQTFAVIVDYAHEPASLEAAYKAVRLFEPRQMIALLGSQGGGRDRWKRAEMGRIAARYCDQIVLSNEDPYDEDPQAILDDIEEGIKEQKSFKPVYKIPDRREGIRKALLLAQKGDAVILTGKGGEVWMCVEHDRKIAWNEREVVEDVIRENTDALIVRSGRNMRFEE